MLWRGFLVSSLTVAASFVSTVLAGDQYVIPPDGRIRANSVLRMAVPNKSRKPVQIDIVDPWNNVVWYGSTSEETFDVLARDWADGRYTVRFEPGGEVSFKVDSEFIDSVRSRCGLMLRIMAEKRDADGQMPKEMTGSSNLIQRLMTTHLYVLPEDHISGNLAHGEQVLGIKTGTVTFRILGSGSSLFTGYEGRYKPFQRERTMMFVPPNAVCDFAANGHRKLKRWGYSVKDIDHLFITHPHGDHFDEAAIAKFAQLHKRAGKREPLRMFSGKNACDRMEKYLKDNKITDADLKIIRIETFKEYQAGDITIKPVDVRHSVGDDPLCFIMRWKGITSYYGTDTGYPPAQTIEALKKERFDVFAHEITVASAEDGITHSDLGDVQLLVDKLRRAGAIDTWTRVVSLHQDPKSTYALPDYLDWQRIVGFECSYDGMPVPAAYQAGK
jgi:L-ascorbate metabolism protein UlaG (beta-lactamase superfamily)